MKRLESLLPHLICIFAIAILSLFPIGVRADAPAIDPEKNIPVRVDEAGHLFLVEHDREISVDLYDLRLQGTFHEIIITVGSRDVTTDASIRVLRSNLSPDTLRVPLDEGQLTLHLSKHEPFDLKIGYDEANKLAVLDLAGSLTIGAVETEGSLEVRLTGAQNDRLTLGPVGAAALAVSVQPGDRVMFDGPTQLKQNLTVTGDGAVIINDLMSAPLGLTSASRTFRLNPGGAIEVATGDATIHTTEALSLQESRLDVLGDLRLQSDQAITIRDSVEQPLIVKSQGQFRLQGDQTIDIYALQHPDSVLISGGDMTLRSENAVRGDVHYVTGGKFEIEQPDGRPGDLVSPHDPIVLANGDVSLGDYIGASLHILAGGNVSLLDVTITGSDTAANSVNPGNATLFNGTDTIGSLAGFNLSNGTAVTINGNTAPTLDVRAGIDWTTFAGGAPNPANQVLPPASVSPSFGGATGATISIDGVISITQPAGVVLLTNQFQPNGLVGEIETGDINTFTTTPNSNGGSVMIDSRGDITTGAIDTSTEVLGIGVTAGNGGPITLLAPAGSINTAGGVTSFARVPGNNSGTVGNGGSIFMAAAADISVNGGTGGIDSFAFANSDGNAGDGGDITISASSLNAARLFAQSFAGSNGSGGNGGVVSINATNGAVNIIESGFVFASIQTFAQDFSNTAGNAGTVTITATNGISLSHGIDARANGTDSQGGDMALTTTNGNINVDFLRTFATNGVTPGNAGNVTVQALNGSITTGDVTAFSDAFFINNDARDGGDILMQADGDINTGTLESYSAARGAQGDAGFGGNISLEAINGSITGGGDLLAYSLSAINNGDSSLAVDGGIITLQASQNISITGRLDSSSVAQVFGGEGGMAANGGPISITATNGSIAIGGNIATQASARDNATNGGDISLTAATGIQINNGAGVINASTNSTEGSVSNGGAVTLNTNSGDLDLQLINSSATNTFGNGPAGNGGSINLTTGNGHIQLTGNLFAAIDSSASTNDTAGQAGDVSLSATQGLTVSAQIRALGLGTVVDGGDITLTTDQGNITTAALLALSQNNDNPVGSGGNVTVQAFNGGITTGPVDTYADALLIHNTTGDGGNIILQAFNGDVVSGPLQSYTEARGEFGDTGNAGLVDVIATNGAFSSMAMFGPMPLARITTLIVVMRAIVKASPSRRPRILRSSAG
jgi:hypothetical protein